MAGSRASAVVAAHGHEGEGDSLGVVRRGEAFEGLDHHDHRGALDPLEVVADVAHPPGDDEADEGLGVAGPLEQGVEGRAEVRVGRRGRPKPRRVGGGAQPGEVAEQGEGAAAVGAQGLVDGVPEGEAVVEDRNPGLARPG